MTKSSNLKLVETRDPAREALAQAIAERDSAQAVLNAAHAAEAHARDRHWAANDMLAAITQRHLDQPVDGAERFIAQPAAGHGIDIDEIERPAATRAQELARAQREIDALGKAREAIESGMEAKRRALEWAQRHVDDVAREVIAASVDVEKLLAETLAIEDAAVAARAGLIALRRILPHGAEQRAIGEHLARPWLEHEYGGAWQRLPAAQHYHEFAEALTLDADAMLSI